MLCSITLTAFNLARCVHTFEYDMFLNIVDFGKYLYDYDK